jgi:hypothetical protein
MKRSEGGMKRRFILKIKKRSEGGLKIGNWNEGGMMDLALIMVLLFFFLFVFTFHGRKRNAKIFPFVFFCLLSHDLLFRACFR